MKLIPDPSRLSKRRSLSRTLWRTLASLPSREQINRLIAREVARAERNGLHFSLVLFRVKRNGRLGLNEKRLALTLLRRVRVTDEVGWFDDSHLCAVLPDTSASGAQVFADSACDLVARKGPRPIATIYSFPFNWRGEDGKDDDGGGGEGGDVAEARKHLLAERFGLGDADGAQPKPARRRANGNGHGNRHNHVHGPNPMNRDQQVGVALEDAEPGIHEQFDVKTVLRPQQSVSARPADEAQPIVQSIQDLLVQPMPLWKRSLDLLCAVFMLLLLSPILLLSAAAIKLTSRGPVVFKQKRAGLGGRPFTIYKFRTMCIDAEAKKKDLRKFSEQEGPAFKMARDPRITRVGAFLRKTSIDELPQLFNVIKGDMSLVGPPLPLDEQNAAETWQQRRLDVTPGLTCIWQITGRSRVTFAEWVRMDVAYMRRRTMFHDLTILLKTVPAVLLRRGAR